MGTADSDESKLNKPLMVRLDTPTSDLLTQMADEMGNTPAALARLATKALVDHYKENGQSITFPMTIRFEAKERLQLAAEDAGKYTVRKAPPRVGGTAKAS